MTKLANRIRTMFFSLNRARLVWQPRVRLDMGIIPEAIVKMLSAADSEDAVFPPTLFYEEGWMLRLILFSAAEGINCLPFKFAPGSKWYSEALLASPFHARHRNDELAEAYTHADGIVGHFNFRAMTKAGLELRSNATQFVVLEAKMSSGLSAGTRRAVAYDQAARTVACMARTIERDRIPLGNLDSVGFYLIAPEDQLKRGVFEKQMTRENIVEKVSARIEEYEKDGVKTRQLREWFEGTFQPMLRRIDLSCWSWEAAVSTIAQTDAELGKQVQAFYHQCIACNQSQSIT